MRHSCRGRGSLAYARDYRRSMNFLLSAGEASSDTHGAQLVICLTYLLRPIYNLT